MIPSSQRHVLLWVLGSCLSVAGVASTILAWQQIAQVMQAAERQPAVYFDLGLTAADLRAPAAWTNEHCGSCHPRAYDQWARSRHAVSGTTYNFQVEFLEPEGGRQQHCLNCHAPRNPTGDLLPTEKPLGIDEAFAAPRRWVKEGIDCLTCHVRNGQVLVTRHSNKAAEAHPIRVAPELATAEFCGGCHQFSFKSHVLPDGYFGQLQQSSFEEFLEFRANGGAETRCQECHMIDGDHMMPGGYDDDMLKTAVDLELRAAWEPETKTALIEVDVVAGHVGHRVPGGEHFRFLTVQTTITDRTGETIQTATHDVPGDAKLVAVWPQVEMLRREMGPAEQGSDNPDDLPHPDTRLWPGETRPFRYRAAIDADTVQAPLKVRAELWYHLMHQSKAESFGHSLDDVERMVLSDEVPLDLGDGR